MIIILLDELGKKEKRHPCLMPGVRKGTLLYVLHRRR